jgi:hypothetical protein
LLLFFLSLIFKRPAISDYIANRRNLQDVAARGSIPDFAKMLMLPLCSCVSISAPGAS